MAGRFHARGCTVSAAILRRRVRTTTPNDHSDRGQQAVVRGGVESGGEPHQLCAETGTGGHGQVPDAHRLVGERTGCEPGCLGDPDRGEGELGYRLDDVDPDEPQRRDLVAGGEDEGQRDGQEAQPADEHAGTHLGRGVRVAAAESDPEPGHGRREDDDRERVDRQEPGGRKAVPEQCCRDVVRGELGEHGGPLLEHHPEGDRREKERDVGDESAGPRSG